MSPVQQANTFLATRIPYLRHSSSNSTDSGCPLLEDKIASLSPTPSPRTNMESLMTSNRTKLANFWERSVVSNTAETTTWSTYKDGFKSTVKRGGFQPVRRQFGSEQSLSDDRVAHFHDVTRRAAAERLVGPFGGTDDSRVGAWSVGDYRLHRASVGSDCSDLMDKTPSSPQARRRESLTEYFV